MIPPEAESLLCLFFMHLVLAAGRAKLFQLQLVSILLFEVAMGVIVEVLAHRALQADEIVLTHNKASLAASASLVSLALKNKRHLTPLPKYFQL